MVLQPVKSAYRIYDRHAHVREFRGVYQPPVPGAPLNGPTTSEVIQPP